MDPGGVRLVLPAGTITYSPQSNIAVLNRYANINLRKALYKLSFSLLPAKCTASTIPTPQNSRLYPRNVPAVSAPLSPGAISPVHFSETVMRKSPHPVTTPFVSTLTHEANLIRNFVLLNILLGLIRHLHVQQSLSAVKTKIMFTIMCLTASFHFGLGSAL